MKILASVLATAVMVALAFLTATPQAQAGGGVGYPLCAPVYICSNWYDNPNGTDDQTYPVDDPFYAESVWTYPQYPLNCNGDDPDVPGIRIIAAVPTGTTNTNHIRTHLSDFREVVRRASSIYAASTKRAYDVAGAPTKSHDRTPRWVTFTDSSGTCQPAILWEEFPQATLDQFPQTSGGIYDQLIARGYNNPNRKYLVVHVSDGFPPPGGGSANDGWGGGVRETNTTHTDPGQANDPNPLTNPNDQGGTRTDFFSLYVGKPCSTCNGDAEWVDGGIARKTYVLAHEMAHNLGAVPDAAPHGQPNGTHISNDGRDIMQYEDTAATTTHCPAVRNLDRFDCGKDDYFSIASPSWQTSWWNMARSRYLWNG